MVVNMFCFLKNTKCKSLNELKRSLRKILSTNLISLNTFYKGDWTIADYKHSRLSFKPVGRERKSR